MLFGKTFQFDLVSLLDSPSRNGNINLKARLKKNDPMGGGPSLMGSGAMGVGLRAVSGIGLESQGGTAHGRLMRGAELDRPDAGPCPAQPPNFTSGETEVTD